MAGRWNGAPPTSNPEIGRLSRMTRRSKWALAGAQAETGMEWKNRDGFDRRERRRPSLYATDGMNEAGLADGVLFFPWLQPNSRSRMPTSNQQRSAASTSPTICSAISRRWTRRGRP